MISGPRGGELGAFGRRFSAELYIAVVAVGSLLFLRLQGLEYGWNTVAFILPAQLLGIPSSLLLGVLLRAAATRLCGRSVGEYWRSIRSWRWLGGWLRLWFATSLMFYTYVWLKVSIPLIRPQLYDPQLWQLDRWLHFGFAPAIFVVELSAGTVLPPALDLWYAAWIYTLPLMLAWVLASPDHERRAEFVLANNILWTAGAWIYLALPSVGPCYAFPEILEPIRAQMPLAIQSQGALWANYGLLIGSRTSGMLDHFSPLLGVAALPSLHVALHGFFALWCGRHERPLRLFWWIATGLTLLASVVSGWHYAVDGYLGMLLAWAAVIVAGRVWRPAAVGAESGQFGQSGESDAPA